MSYSHSIQEKGRLLVSLVIGLEPTGGYTAEIWTVWRQTFQASKHHQSVTANTLQARYRPCSQNNNVKTLPVSEPAELYKQLIVDTDRLSKPTRDRARLQTAWHFWSRQQCRGDPDSDICWCLLHKISPVWSSLCSHAVPAAVWQSANPDTKSTQCNSPYHHPKKMLLKHLVREAQRPLYSEWEFLHIYIIKVWSHSVIWILYPLRHFAVCET